MPQVTRRGAANPQAERLPHPFHTQQQQPQLMILAAKQGSPFRQRVTSRHKVNC